MGIEGQSGNPVPSSEEETAGVACGITRREFLKGLGAMALYPGAAFAEEKENLPKDAEQSAIERMRIYEKGLTELRLEARVNLKEQQRLFIDNGAESKWIPLEEGDQTGSIILFNPIREGLMDKNARVEHFHTHPKALIPSGFTMPPSLQDIMVLPEIRKEFKDDIGRLSFSTLDEQGRWTYGIDFENPAVYEALAFKQITEDKFDALKTNPEFKTFFASQGGKDVRLKIIELMKREEEFGPKTRAMIEIFKEASSGGQKLAFYKEAIELEIKQGSILPTPEKVQERIEALRKIGIIVSFTPFNKTEQ